MKKLVITLLIALTATLAPGRASDETVKRDDLITHVESCEAILQEFMGRPETAIPASVLARARAIVITNQFKAGFLIGVQDGYGVILVKKASGRWSVPVLIKAGAASLGFQLGATSVETVFVITDDQTPRLMFNNRFNVGVDAKAVAGPHASEKEDDNHAIINAPVLVYMKNSGLYAGATLRAGYLARNDPANRLLYNTAYVMPELLYSDWVSPIPEVQPLMNLVQRLAP
jgi:lipid-binding SYLF domain-containing protein